MDNNKGFTLVELLAIMIIIGIIISIAAYKFMNFTSTAESQMVDSCISELNTREKHTWMNAKLDGSELTYTIDLDIGNGAVAPGGGDDDFEYYTIRVSSTVVEVKRTLPTRTQPGIWSRNG